MEAWIRPTLGDVAVAAGAPATAGGADDQVRLTLIGTVPVALARVAREPEPLILLARYLVTVAAAQPADANRMIVDLAFAALDAGEPELERDGPSLELWPALGLAARPALLVRTRLERARGVTRAPRVRELVTRWSRSRTLTGRVVGPGEVPIAGARIELAGAGVATYSDHRGDFRFTGVPTGPPVPTLAVTAKGTRLTLPADAPDGESLLIRIPLPES